MTERKPSNYDLALAREEGIEYGRAQEAFGARRADLECMRLRAEVAMLNKQLRAAHQHIARREKLIAFMAYFPYFPWLRHE